MHRNLKITAVVGWILGWLVIAYATNSVQLAADTAKYVGIFLGGAVLLRLVSTVQTPVDEPPIPLTVPEMRVWGWVLLLGLIPVCCFAIAGSYNYLPPPATLTMTVIPTDVEEVTSHWKGGAYTVGYRIIAESTVFVTDGGGLNGQSGMAFSGPGLVQHCMVDSFKPVYQAALRARQECRSMTLSGDRARDQSGQPIYWQGMSVVLLYSAEYAGVSYQIDRNPWH